MGNIRLNSHKVVSDVGLNEAVRAANAYLLSCIATPA